MLLLLLGGFASCGGDLNPEDEGNYRHQKVKDKPVMKTIRLQFGGDYVSESEEPLLRAEDGETYVGINVRRTKKDQKDAKPEMYAYGLFPKKDEIRLDVLTGYIYQFEATVLIEQEDKIVIKGKEYGEPFERLDETSAPFLAYRGCPTRFFEDDGGFNYASKAVVGDETTYLAQLSSGTAHVGINQAMYYPQVKRFYGTKDSFDPSLTDEVEIEMSYMCFGIKFILESIPDGTSVTVSDNSEVSSEDAMNKPNCYLQFPSDMRLSMDSESSKTWEGVYSLNKLNEKTHVFNLEFTWDKGNGEAESFPYSVTVTANKQKVLKLNIDGDVNETKSGNIILTMEDIKLEEEDPEEIIQKFH